MKKPKAQEFSRSFSGNAETYYGNHGWRLRAFITKGKSLPLGGIVKFKNVRLHLSRDVIRVREKYVAIDIPADILRSALRQAGVIK
jgi:hypothetical protein